MSRAKAKLHIPGQARPSRVASCARPLIGVLARRAPSSPSSLSQKKGPSSPRSFGSGRFSSFLARGILAPNHQATPAVNGYITTSRVLDSCSVMSSATRFQSPKGFGSDRILIPTPPAGPAVHCFPRTNIHTHAHAYGHRRFTRKRRPLFTCTHSHASCVLFTARTPVRIYLCCCPLTHATARFTFTPFDDLISSPSCARGRVLVSPLPLPLPRRSSQRLHCVRAERKKVPASGRR